MHRLDALAPERIAPGAFRLSVFHEDECRRLVSLLEVSDAWESAEADGCAVISADRMTPQMLIYAEAVHRLVDAVDGACADGTWPHAVAQEFRRGGHGSQLAGGPVALTVLLGLAVDAQGTGDVVLAADAGRPLPVAVPAGTAVVVDGAWSFAARGPRTDLLVRYARVSAEETVQ